MSKDCVSNSSSSRRGGRLAAAGGRGGVGYVPYFSSPDNVPPADIDRTSRGRCLRLRQPTPRRPDRRQYGPATTRRSRTGRKLDTARPAGRLVRTTANNAAQPKRSFAVARAVVHRVNCLCSNGLGRRPRRRGTGKRYPSWPRSGREANNTAQPKRSFRRRPPRGA